MKKIYTPISTVCLFILLSAHFSFAGIPDNWSKKIEPQKVFIENRGQFKIQVPQGFDPKVQYAYHGGGQNFYFTLSGVVFQLTDIKKPKQKESEEREMKERMKKGMTAEDHAKMEAEEHRLTITKDELRAQWIGASPNVQIIAEGKESAYYSYSFKDETGKDVNENEVPGFKKLTYRDLYPNIDVVYELHPDGGIKYSLIVHPGGDISQVRLQYSKKARETSGGDIKTKSRFGDFIDHAPVTYYEDGKTPITSSYILKDNVISFSVPNYDATKTIVIDPWTQAPNFAGSGGWQCIWECQKDAANNVYVIGGVSYEELMKFNSAGALQWTYVTPYDTANCWLGTFAVDNAGNSYVTRGSAAGMIKVSTAGGVLWNNANPGGLFSLTEWWDISFNCDQTQLVVGGTGGTAFGGPIPYIYNIDMTSGNVLNSVQVTGGGLFLPQEVRAITACGNGNYYFLSHDSIGYIHQATASCLPFGASPFHVNNSYALGYKCEDFRVNNTGIKAIKAFGGYVYTHRGNQVHKRKFSTAAIIATGTIPGGVWNTGFGGNYVSNSGIDIDSCGNVYVGSINEVVKFDANLNQIATYPTSSNFNVYDVQVSPNGNVIAAGSTGNDNSGGRTGYVETFNAGACPTIAIVCCDPSICPHASVCATDPAFNFTPTIPGGVWSGTGITNTSTGTFNPSVAGVGTFTIYYTLPCGTDSTTISVNTCSATTVCRNANGTLTVSGGTAPYTWAAWDSTGRTCQGGIILFGNCTGTWVTTYGWGTFATGAATTVTPPTGVDSVRVTDNAGTVFTSYNISTLPPCVTCTMVVTPGTVRNVSCFGGSNGSAIVNASGGTTPYTYSWSATGSTVDSAFNLAQGTYTVTVHDANGCTGTASFTISQPATAVTATSAVTAATCGNNNGKVVLTVSGGTPAYSYVWSPNVSTVDSAVNLAANTYNVTVTDSKGCTFATSANVPAAAGITVTPGTVRNVSCFGGNNGSAIVNVSGGTTPYTYVWSATGSVVDSAFNLAQGTYTVTVHDANGCSGTASFNISQPTTLSATNVVTPATCGNSNGKVVFTASGGTPGYTYVWSPNVSTVDSAVNLATNTYNVTVTDSKGCTFATSANVPSAAGITVSPGTIRNVSCFGGNNGSAIVNVSGGTTPYTYVWSATGSVVDSAFNLAQGTYTVTVHDANGCSGTASFNLSQPTTLSATNVVTPATCGNSNGKVVFTAAGGTPGYTYVWSPNVSIVDSATNLSATTYNVTVTDSKGCTFATSASVPAVAGITVSPGTIRNVSCFGGNNGSAIVNTTGGTTPYTYVWSATGSVVDSAFNLAQGTYTVTVHDANGCSGTASFNISQPAAAVSATSASTPATCGNNNGKVVLTVSGGTPAYSYTWSPNVSTVDSAINLGVATYNITVTDSKGCPFITSVSVVAAGGVTVSPGPKTDVSYFGGNNGSAHVTVTGGTTPYTYTWSLNVSSNDSAVNLSQGTYTVTVHDANGCSGTASFTIGQPASALGITNTTVPATCGNNNGKVVFTVTGGTPAYAYIWSPNISTTDSAVNLSVGSYNITVTDSKGCTMSSSASVISSSGFSVSPGVKTDVSCFGGSDGSAHVITSGGTTPYTYIWSPNVSTNDSAINLAMGTYDVTVHDANNCSGTISFNIAQPTQLGATKTVTQGSCGNNNGKIILNVTGGTPSYSYVWSPNISTTDSAVNLGANTYSVTVTDAKGCTASVSQAITVSPAISVTPGPTVNIGCFNGNNGSAQVNVTGGTAPINYVWSPNVSATGTASNLTAGIYAVTVSDVNGCSGTASFTITQPSAALASIPTITQTTCGNNNGRIVLSTNGGTPVYTYTWSPNVSAVDSAINLAQGAYNITVQDANSCTVLVSANVSPLSGVSLTLASKQDVTCNGGSNGKIFTTTTGGVTPYTYTWSPIVGSNDSAVNLTAGTYSVTVADGSGCTSSLTVTINEPQPINVSVATTQASCGASDGSATATVTGGTGTLVYQWSAGGSTINVDGNIPAGSYVVTVTDANLCTGTGTGAVSNSGAPNASVASQVNENCNGQSIGKIVLNVTGGTQPYTYTWAPNVSSVDSAVNLIAGTYDVTVHDATNCIAVLSVTVTEPQALSATVQSTNADCGVSDGSAQVNVSGGTSPYSYTWSGGGQTTAIINGLASGIYDVTSTDNLGCQILDTVIVGTNNGPPAPVITAGGPTTFCQGDSVVLTSSAATGNIWSTGATSQSITVYAAGSYTVADTVGGCVSSPSAPVVVTLNPIPSAPAITASGPLAFCLGDSVILTSSYASGNTWSNSATTQSITVYTAGTYTVSVVQGGCPGPASAPVTVSILTGLQPQIIASKPTICPGDTVLLNATTANASTYLWSTGATQPIIAVTNAGFYQVTVSSNVCSGTDTITIGTMLPLGTFQLPDSLILCSGDSVTLDATAKNAASYQWSGILANTPTVTIKASGIYYVTVSNSCGSTIESSVIRFNDCDCRIVMPNAFTPNGDGINDYFAADFKCDNAKYFNMRIFNRWGEKIFETTDLYGQWDGKYRGVLQEPGVYVYYADFVGMDHNVEKTFKLKGSITLIR